jgi:ectoine hydroxylase-related dioxygenase (phytanoyl-CoA dioxygenase family)
MEKRIRFVEIGTKEWLKYHITSNLKQNGYVVIPDVLSKDEIAEYKKMFFKLLSQNEQLQEQHAKNDPHGIFKRGPFAHSLMRANIVTNEKVIDCFESIYDTRNLVTSQDGCAYISPSEKANPKSVWTHIDQSPNSFDTVDEMDYTVEDEYENGKKCVQGFVALTENKDRTFRVYGGSHIRTRKWFKKTGKTGNKNWHKVDKEELDQYEYSDLHVSAGSVVLWDSRAWHQSTNTAIGEERLVVYVCYLPRENPLNTASQCKKRLHYFETKRTTSHWPYSVCVNGEQPQTYGNTSLLIDYSKVVYDVLPKELEEKYKSLL